MSASARSPSRRKSLGDTSKFLVILFASAGVGACAQILGADYHLGPGIPDCGSLEAPSSSRTCARVGIAVCAEGFETDNQGGCLPIMPDVECTGATLGMPGNAVCRPIGSCYTRFHTGQGYSDLPSRKLYVDAAVATEGDGSDQTQPLKSITKALDMAGPAGATVFVAPGEYPEALTIRGPMGLLGACQDSVNIRPPAGSPGIRVESPGGVVWLGKLHVIGGSTGISVTSAPDFRLSTIWIQDPEGPGIVLEDGPLGTTLQTATLLVDGALGAGLLSYGAGIKPEGTGFTVNDPGVTVRRTRPLADGSTGYGIALHAGLLAEVQDPKTARPSTLNLQAMVLEDNVGAGIFIEGSQATIARSVIRRTRANGRGEGRGIVVQRQPLGPVSSSLTLMDSVIADNHDAGILIVDSPAPLDGTAGLDATIERTVIRGGGDGTSPSCHGSGLRIRSDGARTAAPGDAGAGATAAPPIVLRDSVMQDARESAIHVEAASLAVERSVVRGTRSSACEGKYGDGIAVYADAKVAADVLVSTTRIESSARAAVASFGAKTTLNGVVAEGCGGACVVGTDRGGAAPGVSVTTSRCGPPGALAKCGPSTSSLEPALRGGNGCAAFGADGVCLKLCLESIVQRLATPTDLDKSITPVSRAALWVPEDLGRATAVAGDDGCLEAGGLPRDTDLLLAYGADGVDTNGYLPHLFHLHTGNADSNLIRIPTSPNVVWVAWPGVLMDPRVSGYLGVLLCPPPAPADVGKTECLHRGIDGVSLVADSGLAPEVRYTSTAGAPDPATTTYTSTATAVFVNVPSGIARFSVIPPAGKTLLGCNMDHQGGWATLRMVDSDTAEIPMRPGFLSATALYCDVQ